MEKIKLMAEEALIEQSRRGIDKKHLLKLLSGADMTMKELASILNVSTRSIQKKADNERFSSYITERALFISKLYDMGKAVFGDYHKFNKWMDTKNPSMGNVTPKSFLDTFTGIQLIENKLNEIIHGFAA